MKKQSYKTGFTLLELLIVIAVIGILAAVIVASLSSAKSKGNDAAVRQNLGSLRSQSEIYYSSYKNFGTNTVLGDCTTTSTIMASTTAVGSFKNIIPDLRKNAGGAANTLCSVAAGGTSWAASARLVSGGYACTDSTGVLVASSTGTLVNSIAVLSSTCVR